MELIVMIVLGICVFMFSVYFTRWVFGIDQIIQLQKEILKELKQKTNSKSIKNIDFEKTYEPQNNSIIKPIRINDFCPACNTIIKANDTECSKCGLNFSL